MSDFSRQLRERAAQLSPADPAGAAAASRAALRAYDLARLHRFKSALSLLGAGLASACLAYFIVLIASPGPSSGSSSVAATAGAPPPPVEIATAAPAAPPEAKPPAVPTIEPPVVTAPAVPDSQPAAPAIASQPAAPAMASQPAPVEPAPSEVSLKRDEIREVQARLRSFGFDPGPVDGNAGRMTEAAVMRYQQQRSQLQTGTADRELLEQLRQDPAPQVAQRPVRPARAGTVPRRSGDPFEPVRATGERVGRWLESLMR